MKRKSIAVIVALSVFAATASFGKTIKAKYRKSAEQSQICYKIPLPNKPEWLAYNLSDDLTTGEVWLKPDDADTLALNLENVRLYAQQLEDAISIHNRDVKE